MSIGLPDYTYTRTLGRKRVVVSNNVEAFPRDAKRICSCRISQNSGTFPLEALPLDIMIQVLRGVDHQDLEQLVQVSKTIRKATRIVKELHFKYSTPKKTFVLHNPFDLDDPNFQEIEPPNAPLIKSKSRWRGKRLAGISTTLFASGDEEQ
ncbi:F-box protein At1g61340-like [Abrus precatorius]|uniref:F-box protein At1g61340-like n=1 Tax=Abrus precatorius TaxID=3816 RepID=A0A8B8K4V6_ABRPR|nr:F-box protein At1g61340-like [Abrus precatorius]